MRKFVRIRNLTAQDIVIGDRTIPALGTLVLSYSEYFAKALEYDLTKINVRVTIPDTSFSRVTVREFGAKGDGVHDDTEFVQAAIDCVAGYGGGVVEVPTGIYAVSGIVVRGDVSLEGESRHKAVLKRIDGSVMPTLSFVGTTGVVSNLRVVV